MDVFTGTMLQHMVDDNKQLFQGLLPELVKRLILLSCSKISQIRIPGKDDVWAPGFDGIVQNSVSTKYVCDGTSVWEIGTNSKSLKKINSDYNKRTTKSLSINKTNTEFYLVIPYIWAYDNHGEPITKWESEHKGDWKNVHVFDATILADWINAEPAVCAWLLEQVGREKEIDFSSVLYAWKRFSSKTHPAFSKSLFLNSRESEMGEFWNGIEKQIIRVRADSTIDSYGFCLSAILEKEELTNSIIVVNNYATYKKLCDYCNNKLLLLNFKLDCDIIPGNRVILCFNKEDRPFNVDIELPQLTKTSFEKALKDMGLPDDRLRAFYEKTHGSLLSLIRKIPGSVPSYTPKWAKQDRIELLVPLLFLGNFDMTNEDDRNIVAFLANESYEIVIDKYNAWLSLEDAPVKQIDSYWVLIDYEETWEVLNLSIFSPFYERLLRTIEAIIMSNSSSSEVGDLKVTDSRSKRHLHNLFLDLINFSNADEAGKVDKSVQVLLEKLPFSKSILEHFSLLAEAAPSVVMSFLEGQEHESGGIIEQCFLHDGYTRDYCNILFALDELVLHEETRVRACDFLYNLCVKTQSMKFVFSNSPRESLLIALCLWNDRTLFTLNEKEGLIKKYLSKEDAFVAGFVTDLLLKKSAIFGVRDGAKQVPKMPISPDELNDTTNKIAKEVFQYIIRNHHLTELKKLLIGYEYFSNDTLLDAADIFLIKEYEPDQIIPINYELRRIAYFAGKNDIRKSRMVGLNRWIDVTTPLNCIFREGWMFYEYYSYFSFDEVETDNCIDEREEKNNKIRKATLAKFVQTSEPREAACLVQCSKDDIQMGLFYGRTLESEYLYSFAQEAYRLKKVSILCGIIEGAGKADCIRILNSLKADDQLIVLSTITRNDILEWIDTPEKERSFWNHQTMRKYDESTYKKLLTYNPLNLLPYYAHLRNQPLLTSVEKIKEIISAILATHTASPPRNLDSYALDDIISSLDKEGYATDEWAEICARLCDNGWLQQYPNILKEYYFSHPDILCNKLLEINGSIYSQFCSYYELPNCAYFDSNAFSCFVDTFFAKHTKDDFLISALGGILSKSREGLDRIFPSENVRIALEKYKATDLWRNVFIGIINNRGLRSIGDGSGEMRLAKEFRNNAKKVEIDYPETARLLRELSEAYSSEGRRDRLFSEIGTDFW